MKAGFSHYALKELSHADILSLVNIVSSVLVPKPGFKGCLYDTCSTKASVLRLLNFKWNAYTTRPFPLSGFSAGLFSCNYVSNNKKVHDLWILTCKFHLQQPSGHTVHKNCFPLWKLKNNYKTHEFYYCPIPWKPLFRSSKYFQAVLSLKGREQQCKNRYKPFSKATWMKVTESIFTSSIAVGTAAVPGACCLSQWGIAQLILPLSKRLRNSSAIPQEWESINQPAHPLRSCTGSLGAALKTLHQRVPRDVERQFTNKIFSIYY